MFGKNFAFRGVSLSVAAGLLASVGVPADAALIGTLSYTVPTGIVGPTDSIDIMVKLALDASSDALTTDSNGNIVSGAGADDWTAAGIDPSLVAGSYLNVFFECSGTFTTVCNQGPPYNFDFAPNALPAGLDVQPGSSYTFLFGTFSPSDGPVAAGTYTWYNMGITANPYDASGNTFPNDQGNPTSITLFQSCRFQDSACAFTRTVEAAAAVPEPTSWALMIGGFALAGAAMRRRSAAVRFA